jgi:hypothetical protein
VRDESARFCERVIMLVTVPIARLGSAGTASARIGIYRSLFDHVAFSTVTQVTQVTQG